MFISNSQLKAARSSLNFGVRDIGRLIQTSGTTISKLENGIIKISNMKLAERRNTVLIEFFKKNKVIFPSSNSISYCSTEREEDNSLNEFPTFTRFQLKVSRAIINKSNLEIATFLGLSESSISYSERRPNETFVRIKNPLVVSRLINYFMQHKITFPNPFTVVFENNS